MVKGGADTFGVDIMGQVPVGRHAVQTVMTWLPEASVGSRRRLLGGIIAAAAERRPFGFVYGKPRKRQQLTLDTDQVLVVCRGMIHHTDPEVRRAFANCLATVDWTEAMPLLGYLTGDADLGVRRRAYFAVKQNDVPLFQALRTLDQTASELKLPGIATPGASPRKAGLESTVIKRRTDLGYTVEPGAPSRMEITLQLRIDGAADPARSLDIRVPAGKEHATLLVHTSSESGALKVAPEVQTIKVPRNRDSDVARLTVTALRAGDSEVAITIFDEFRLVGSIAVVLRAEELGGALVLKKLRDVVFRDAGDGGDTRYIGPTIQLSLTNEAVARIQFHMPALNESGQLELVPLGYSREGYDAFAVLNALTAASTRIEGIERNLGSPRKVGVETSDQVLELLALDFQGIAREIVDNLISLQTRTVLARLGAAAVVQWVIKSPKLDAVPWELAFQSSAQSTLKEPVLLVRVPVRDEAEAAGSFGTPGIAAAGAAAQIARKLVYVVGEGVASDTPTLNEILGVVKIASEKGLDVVPNVTKGTREPTNLLKLKSSFSQADIIHVLCHGLVESSGGGLFLKIENNAGGQLLPHHIRAFGPLPKQPLVFVNACSSAAATFGAVGFTSFARSFLGAGASAYIGTLAPVVTTTALRFATAFFDALLGKDLSFAEAMNAAHAVMAGDPDPTWRLYAVYGDLNDARLYTS